MRTISWLSAASLASVLFVSNLTAQVFVPAPEFWPPPDERPPQVPRPEVWPPPGERPPRIPPPQFWPPPDRRPIPAPPRLSPIEVVSSKNEVRITDQIAFTRIEQELYNPHNRRIEGSFLFPIPKGAHLDKFTLEIDGKPVEAELLDAKQARRIYEDIVRKALDPALLEYADRGLFRVRVFPIEAQSSRRVAFRYTQVLQADAGLVNYVHPLTMKQFSSRPIKSLSLKVEIESKRPIKTIYSPTHQIDISRPGPRKAVAGFEASDILPETDFQLFYSAGEDDVGLNLLTHQTGGEDGYFLLFASPGVDAGQTRVLLKDVVFVLDTSGSMAGRKMEQARQALLFCVENLNDGDRFEIVRFSTDVELLFDGLVEASRDQRQRATRFVEKLRATGATAIHDALLKTMALRPEKTERPFYVVFLTDGQPTIGVTDPSRILTSVTERAVRDGEVLARIFCFGIGTDVNTHLLDKIAENTKAFSQYVLPEEDLEIKVSSFFAKISEPILTDPEIRFPNGIRVTRMYPSPLPDLFKGEQLILAGRYAGSGKGKIVIEGKVNGAAKTFEHEAGFPAQADAHEFIPRLWAMRRVGHLLDAIRLHGDSKELRDEVTELARKYGIVTPYTAYLIIEDEERRNVPQQARALAPLQQNQAVRRETRTAYESFSRDQVGEAAVAGAVTGYGLRVAEQVVEPQAAAPARALSVRGRSVGFQRGFEEAAGQTRLAGGRAFYQNGSQWVDSEVQRAQNARTIRVQFNSPDYFELMRTNQNALPWLALGRNVQFVHGNTVYEIHE